MTSSTMANSHPPRRGQLLQLILDPCNLIVALKAADVTRLAIVEIDL
jgi:hypothetical protein